MRAIRSVALFVCAFAAFLGSGAPAALAAPPSFTVDPVTESSITSAQVSGTVTFDSEENGGAEGSWSFQYCENASPGECTAASSWSYGSEAFTHTLPAGTSAQPVTEALTGLKPDTEYSVRLAALPFSDFIEVFSDESTYRNFTTDPATAPVLGLDAPGSVSLVSATLSGTVNPEGGNEDAAAGLLPISWELQFAPLSDPENWQTAGSVTENPLTGSNAEASTDVTVEANATGFTPDTAYRTRIVAHYAGLTATLPEVEYEEFTTDAASNAPTLAIEPAGALTKVKAHIAGTLNPNGGNVDAQTGPLPIHWELQYTKASEPTGWQTGKSGTVEGEGAEGADSSSSIPLSADLTGLATGTEYLYRLVATYGGEEETSSNGSFETLSSAGPDVSTGAADHITPTSAYLRGTVNPNEEATSYWFEYGAADCASSACTAVPLEKVNKEIGPEEFVEELVLVKRPAGSGDADLVATYALGGLDPDTTYHFRALAENASGTAAGADQTFTTAPTPEVSCPNEARRAEQSLSSVLGSCRAWELASVGTDKDVAGSTSRTVASDGRDPDLPAAVAFASLSGFGDVQGNALSSEYLAQRSGEPGGSGWTVHGITPVQEPLPQSGATSNLGPLYEYFSPNLTRGVFHAWSPIGEAPNVSELTNVYVRDDLRAAGPGNYELFSDSATLQPPVKNGLARPWFAGASDDVEHLVFESRRNLTEDATGPNIKLYKSDGGVVRLVRANAACAGQLEGSSGDPCSIAGTQATPTGGVGAFSRYTRRVISSDGARVNFTSPFGGRTFLALDTPNMTPGVVSKLFQLDDRGTLATGDDAVIQVSASEKASPEVARGAFYETASSDGSRVFFRSSEQLTEEPGSGLYMWERQDQNEVQGLNVDASGGTFTLTAHTQPSSGSGFLAKDSTEVGGVTGSFTVGQTISGEGIEPGTTVASVASDGTSITLSAPAKLEGQKDLTASIEATTDPLPWDATATQVQAALTGLAILGSGNVAVSGGPAGSAPVAIEFTGGLAGVNVMELTADGSGLSGGASSAGVTTSEGVSNLTLIGPGAVGVFGASEDGHRVYFDKGDDVWYWQDADDTPGGTLMFVATLGDKDNLLGQYPGGETTWESERAAFSRLTPDGRWLMFGASDGAAIPPGYQHGERCHPNTLGSGNRCVEAYVFRADHSKPGDPDIVCASCNLAEPRADGNTYTYTFGKGINVGLSGKTSRLNRAITDDGRYVFFTTGEPLVPEDTNGVFDAYQYDVQSGEASLLSSGTSPSGSFFMDASSDGTDVFFITREQLSAWDNDPAYDLYDARAGGGFPEPPPPRPVCSGDSCRPGGGQQVQAPTSPGSSTLVGHGNRPEVRKLCPKGSRKVRRHGKTRCVKKHRKHKRTANADRRAGR